MYLYGVAIDSNPFNEFNLLYKSDFFWSDVYQRDYPVREIIEQGMISKLEQIEWNRTIQNAFALKKYPLQSKRIIKIEFLFDNVIFE